MSKQLLVIFCLMISMSSVYAELSEKMNYGWVNRATSNEFDPSSLASSLRYFKNNCAAGTEPCSPDSGVQADGSLFCATGNSTGACYDLSKAGNGMANLKEHLTTKCGSSCLQAEKDFYPWYSKKVEFCKSRTNYYCSTYNGEFASTIRSYYTPSSMALNASNGSTSTATNKLIQDIPAGDQGSCDLVKGQGSRVGQNDSPYWKEVLSIANKMCGRKVENLVGYCSASVLPDRIPDDLRVVFDRIRRGEAFDENIFSGKLGLNVNQFKTIFCQTNTHDLIKKANEVAKVVTFPPKNTGARKSADEYKYPGSYNYTGKAPWLQKCMSSGMIQQLPDKVSKQTYANGAGEIVGTFKRYKTNASGNCDFIPVTDFSSALKSGNPSLMLMPKNPRPGTALCVLVKDVNIVTDEANAARRSRGLGPAPSSMKLYVQEGSGAPPSRYDFESVSALTNEFDAFKWSCANAADYEVKQTGGDASEANQ